jgi:hypothetical protein
VLGRHRRLADVASTGPDGRFGYRDIGWVIEREHLTAVSWLTSFADRNASSSSFVNVDGSICTACAIQPISAAA